MPVSGTVLLFEGGFTVVFMTLLIIWRGKDGEKEDSLWGLVWATRLFASLNGSRHMSGNQADLLTYIALQACSGLSLMLILTRYQLKVLKDKLLRRLLVQIAGAEASAAPGVFRGNEAGSREAPLP
jgi:hypothetical protein